MRIQILFAIDDVEQDGIQQVVLLLGVILDNDVLQFFQFGLYVVVLVGKRTDVVVFVQLVMKQVFYVGKYFLVFIFHVTTNLRDVSIIEFQNQKSYVVGTRTIDGINQSPSD